MIKQRISDNRPYNRPHTGSETETLPEIADCSQHRKDSSSAHRNLLLITMIGAVLGYSTPVTAKTIHIDLSNTTDEINRILLEDSGPGDTINFRDGEHNIPYGKWIDLPPNRDYVFGTATINGSGIEQECILWMGSGGNINITATNLTLGKSKIGIGMGDVPYDNININGISFKVYEKAIIYENIKHASPLTQAAINIQFCTADGGDKFVMFDELWSGVDANAPYVGVRNCTLSDMHSDGGIIDVPIYFRETVTGSGIQAKKKGEWVVLGNDEILGNVLRNVSSLSKPADFWVYHSPEDILQEGVATPLVTGNIYNDWYGQPHVFTGENCGVVDANSFVPGTNIPKRDSSMNLGNGRYAGSIEPYHELPGNLDFDEFVSLIDFAIAASRYKGNLNEIKAVADDWLKEEPNDPNGNPKISKATIPALGRCFVDARVRTRGGSDVNPEISGGLGRGSPWLSERWWVEHGGELCLRRVEFYCS